VLLPESFQQVEDADDASPAPLFTKMRSWHGPHGRLHGDATPSLDNHRIFERLQDAPVMVVQEQYATDDEFDDAEQADDLCGAPCMTVKNTFLEFQSPSPLSPRVLRTVRTAAGRLEQLALQDAMVSASSA